MHFAAITSLFSLGEQIATKRKELGLTKPTLAKKLGSASPRSTP